MNPVSPDEPVPARLKLRHLQVFRSVCDHGTVRKASEAIHIAQPAATRLIRELEEIVGVPLFVRHRRGMSPTRYGEVVRRHAGVVFADLGGMLREVGALSQGVSGVLRLGVIPSLDSRLLADSIARTLERWPDVQLTLREGATTELLAALANNELDLTFGRILDVARARSLGVLPIYTERFSIACSTRHPFAQRRFVSWRELVDAGWALPVQGTPLRQLLDATFLRHGVLRPRASVECSGYEQTRHVIAHSELVGVLPRPLALQGRHHGELALLRAKLGGGFAPISLLYRKDVDPPPLVFGYADVVRELARSMKLEIDQPAGRGRKQPRRA